MPTNPQWGAAWSRHDFPGDQGVAYVGSHVSLFFEFVVNGTPVVVENPTFTLRVPGPPPVEVIPRILRPISQVDIDDTRYLVTFIADNLIAGQTYEIVASGTYGGSPVEVIGTLKMVGTDRIQFFIDTLRTHLSDINTLCVPKKYILHDPRVHEWEDGELYAYLLRAVEDVNMTPPAFVYNWNLDTIPIPSLVVTGAMYYALLQHSIMEAHNFFDYSTDVRVSFYSGDKYTGLYQFLRREYMEPLRMFKKDYVWRNIRPRMITLQKYPFRVLRPLSMNLFWQAIYP